MKKLPLALFSLAILPNLASAQTETIQTFVPNFVEFISQTMVGFLLGFAFLFFVFNAVKFFIIEGSNEQGREKAKSLMIWSITAFVVIIIFWGVINIIAVSFGLGGPTNTQPTSDYIERSTD